eukprot:1138983-Pelagomonas_calceolata.AAC.1
MKERHIGSKRRESPSPEDERGVYVDRSRPHPGGLGGGWIVISAPWSCLHRSCVVAVRLLAGH